MIRIKEGVKIQGVTPKGNRIRISPEMVFATFVAERVWAKQGVDLWITSSFEGNHMRGSKHYIGEALDYRRWNLENVEKAAKELQERLGPSFQVVVERTHIHVEYDPPEGEYAKVNPWGESSV